MGRRRVGRGGTHEGRERERKRTVNKEEERGIEKQFTRKSALDLFASRRLFLIGISCYIADGFCVLLRMLFIQPTLLQLRSGGIKVRI